MHTRGVMRRGVLAVIIASLFLLQPWMTSSNELFDTRNLQSYNENQLFNQTGFFEDGTYTTSDGESHVSRPYIQWTMTNTGLVGIKTGACSVAIESINEVWLMGGRADPNPSVGNDEGPTDMVELMDNQNKTWLPADTNMPFAQQYCEAEIIGDNIFVVGDWLRGSNPAEYPSGRVQIYNLTNQTWYNGSPMPSTHERGLGGMAEHNGYLYYAGGVRDSTGNDATNVTFRYDPISDQWNRMANMSQPRASFELINYHGQLYAMGGFQGTQTWNRQALDYVERYDPGTNTWTNLSSLPKAMYGWGGTVLNDEIVLVGGYSGGAKKSVYHWNPIEDTWSAGNDIIAPGHFDLEVESINGSIVWASGDMSTYPYSSWSQTFSAESEYQNATLLHSGWITSPAIDLRPNTNGRATPVQLELLGANTPGGELSFQYRASTDEISLKGNEWIGSDGTMNSTFPVGTTDIDLDFYADFIQYRIKMSVTDLANWDEPNLDSMSVRAEHAAFVSSIPTLLHPRAQTVSIQTSHDIISDGEMYISMASCDSTGSVIGPWSKLSHDGITFSESDTQGLFLQSNGNINSSNVGESLIDWSFDLGDLTGITHLCTKVGSTGNENIEFRSGTTTEIDNILEVAITDLGELQSGGATTGGIPIDVGVEHMFPSTGMTLSSGDLQSRLTFQIHVIDPTTNVYTTWVNQTTPWTNLTIGQTDSIPWTLPDDISGHVTIVLESRSDQSFQIQSNSNASLIILDNDNPVIISSTPANGSYIDSIENREISVLIADTSGFISDEMELEIWVQRLDDGSDGSAADTLAQDNEYRIINHTLENDGSLWWFNATQSDNVNLDHELVYLRINGDDIVGASPQNNTIWWQTRDAQNAVIESISNENQTQFWEVSREINWDIKISDANAITDVIMLRIELGEDSKFGISYQVADSTCSSLDTRIDSDRTLCSHNFDDGIMNISVTLYSGWDVDRSALTEGKVEIFIEDLDGVSKTTFENMWVFSEDFDFQVDFAQDITGPVTGQISNESIMVTGEEMRLTGSISHSLSGLPYQGYLSVTWWGQLQGQSWYGAGTISVTDGIINSSIPMPSTGGILDMSVAFMDPLGTRTIGNYDAPIFIIDAGAPIILQSNTEGHSRYLLNDVGIGVNIVEEVSWNGALDLTCQVTSTDYDWEPVTISMTPSSVFQGKTLFSYSFDLSQQGDPSLLSPEAQIDCWAAGRDDAGWDLISYSGNSLIEPWLTIPLSAAGPNIELVDVKLSGVPESGNSIRVEISVMNSGEVPLESFNITVYTFSDDEKILVGRYTQDKISGGQGITKLVSITVPEGDWTLEVILDEEKQIWELNEDDNSFSKEYTVPEGFNVALYAGIGVGITSVLAVVIIVRRRSGNELLQLKKLPSLDELPRTGPPEASKSKVPISPKRRKGPPPKANIASVDKVVPDISEAMSKLSLKSLPGKNNPQPEKVASFEDLPGGGEYDYRGEGTFYSGKDIGKWKLEADGSFSKME